LLLLTPLWRESVLNSPLPRPGTQSVWQGGRTPFDSALRLRGGPPDSTGPNFPANKRGAVGQIVLLTASFLAAKRSQLSAAAPPPPPPNHRQGEGGVVLGCQGQGSESGRRGGGSRSFTVDISVSVCAVYLGGRYSSVSKYEGGGYGSKSSGAVSWSGGTPPNHYPWQNKPLSRPIY
jgi:hypothetical protein